MSGAGAAVAYFDRQARESVEGIARAADGDTLLIDGRAIRLKDIDAPELEQSCARDDMTYRCGEEAAAALAGLLSGRVVRCSGSGRDRYARLLAYCTAEGEDINAAMVLAGWAVAYGGYLAQERAAKNRRSGLWAGDFEPPHQWRAAREKGLGFETGASDR